MTLKIEISASNMDELAADLKSLGVDVSEWLRGEQGVIAASDAARGTTAAAAAAKEPTRRGGRKPKDQPAGETEQPATAAKEPTAEEAAQDAADESAESAAQADGAEEITADSLRNAMGRYVEAYGGEAATADRAAIFEAGLGKPPEGENTWLFSKIIGSDDKSLLIKAVHAWEEAIETNPFKREHVA